MKKQKVRKSSTTKASEFNMPLLDAISYIKARTCHIGWLTDHNGSRSKSYHLRKAVNNQTFILLDDYNNGMELFVQVDGYTIESLIRAFDLALSKDSLERGITNADLKKVRFIPGNHNGIKKIKKYHSL
jgi:hypothetical protein